MTRIGWARNKRVCAHHGSCAMTTHLYRPPPLCLSWNGMWLQQIVVVALLGCPLDINDYATTEEGSRTVTWNSAPSFVRFKSLALLYFSASEALAESHTHSNTHARTHARTHAHDHATPHVAVFFVAFTLWSLGFFSPSLPQT